MGTVVVPTSRQPQSGEYGTMHLAELQGALAGAFLIGWAIVLAYVTRHHSGANHLNH